MQGVCETAEERGWESGKAEMFPMDIMDMGEDGAMPAFQLVHCTI